MGIGDIFGYDKVEVKKSDYSGNGVKWSIAANSLFNRVSGRGADENLPVEEFGGALYNFRRTVCAGNYCRKQPFGAAYYLSNNNKLIYD